MISLPSKILRELEEHKITKLTAFELLTAIIDNSNSEDLRSRAIMILVKANIFKEKVFEILENLLISDQSAVIRCLAANYIADKFIDQAITPLKWAFENEKNYDCFIDIIKILGNLKSIEAKSILYDEIKRISKLGYLNKDRRIENKKYRKVLKKLLKEKNYNSFTHNELAQIIINYHTIFHLLKKYNNVYYELDPKNALINRLDLSDLLEFEVKGTPWQWRNNIRNLSEITGLYNLTYLKEIDLSNNQLTSIKGIYKLPNLTHVILSHNKLSKEDTIKHLKRISNLIHLDLRGNKIAEKIKNGDFPSKTTVLLKDIYI
ncbi:MAG: leucine-rich repeat domain-containing protein [Candidatus Heimdallarchaeota archaeon]